MAKSMAEIVAELGKEERDEIMAGLDPEEVLWDAGFWLRPEQQAPPGDWNVWLFMAGRGAGKSRSAAEWIREKGREGGQKEGSSSLRLGLVARTAADVRDVLIEGESGILNITPPSERPEWHPSRRNLTWPNGTTALCFTADEPSQLRGPNFHYAWADELAAWRQIPDEMGLTAWANLRIACRLGTHPQIIATTTPKKVKIMKDLIKEYESGSGLVALTRGSTMDNAGNLSNAYIDAIYGIYKGTRLATQELSGEMIDDVEGALWDEDMLERSRVDAAPVGLPLRVVGVDPTVAERPGDECGIVVVLGTAERETYRRECYVVDDQSVWGSPETWAQRVVATARKWGAPVIAETNQGGALVRSAINSIDPGVVVLEVHSRVGKQLRAEPVALAYEQGRVHHLGTHGDLESQMIWWEPGVGKSPDRVDALVHAVTALMVSPPVGLHGGKITGSSVAGRKLPGVGGPGGGGVEEDALRMRLSGGAGLILPERMRRGFGKRKRGARIIDVNKPFRGRPSV